LFRRVELPPDAWNNLAPSGALGAFGSRREVLWHLGRLQKLAPKKRSEQLAFDDLELPRDRLLLEVPSVEQSIAWDFQTCHLTTGPHPLALKRSHLGKLGAKSIRELFALPPATTVTVAGAVISRQRPPTAKGFCFLILEDETGRLPTALPPHLFERFERVLREPVLVVEGRLEAPPEEKRGGKTGVYRSILIEQMWSLDALLTNVAPVHGAAGMPGESPRTGQSRAA